MYDTWFDSNSNKIELLQVFAKIKKYIQDGGKIYVGTDSMLFSTKCIYATAICIHNADMKIANYFFARVSDYSEKSKSLQHKITQEVEYSIEVALLILEEFPTADIEIHADVGTSKRSATSKFVEFIRGWILGSGFTYKVKPHSWASSSVADWHTK